MKFTFKKYIATGKYRSFELDQTDIKLEGRIVGHISESREGDYSISFAIKKEATPKEPADFKWIHLKKRFASEKGAREEIKRSEEAIQKKLNLYQLGKG